MYCVQVFFQPYWCWLVTKVPLWLAPNLITFIGLLINIFTSLPVALLDSNAQGLVSERCSVCFLRGGWGGGGGRGCGEGEAGLELVFIITDTGLGQV